MCTSISVHYWIWMCSHISVYASVYQLQHTHNLICIQNANTNTKTKQYPGFKHFVGHCEFDLKWLVMPGYPLIINFDTTSYIGFNIVWWCDIEPVISLWYFSYFHQSLFECLTSESDISTNFSKNSKFSKSSKNLQNSKN